jgi:hypothetical protein
VRPVDALGVEGALGERLAGEYVRGNPDVKCYAAVAVMDHGVEMHHSASEEKQTPYG